MGADCRVWESSIEVVSSTGIYRGRYNESDCNTAAWWCLSCQICTPIHGPAKPKNSQTKCNHSTSQCVTFHLNCWWSGGKYYFMFRAIGHRRWKSTTECHHPPSLDAQWDCDKKRPRWDDKTNMFMGSCQEHNSKIPLEFDSEKELDIFCDVLNKGNIHLASEVCSASVSHTAPYSMDYSGNCWCIGLSFGKALQM